MDDRQAEFRAAISELVAAEEALRDLADKGHRLSQSDPDSQVRLSEAESDAVQRLRAAHRRYVLAAQAAGET
ncbi:MAG: hypothetical protein EPO13_10220 [Actinomycetota bacterium]|nr:MAG: hypothetical protein EPO13_10220 [Actinomycetota bacterium]